MAIEKITQPFKVGLTETEFNDLCKLCALRDRSLSEYVRVHLIRPHLYGMLPKAEGKDEWANSASGAL